MRKKHGKVLDVVLITALSECNAVNVVVLQKKGKRNLKCQRFDATVALQWQWVIIVLE